MEELREKRKVGGGIWRKTWERCKSFSHTQQTRRVPPSSISTSPTHAILDNNNNNNSSSHVMVKSKSWSTFLPRTPTTPRAGKWVGSKKPNRVGLSTPKGCLSVYVGPEKRRFVIKIECTNHDLFKKLLEEAEMEYGFHSEGPIVLPCDVDRFITVLFEMEADHDDHVIAQRGCSPRARTSSYHPISPTSSNSYISFHQLL